MYESLDKSFPSVRQEPTLGRWKEFPSLQQGVWSGVKSVQFSCSVMSNSLQSHGLQHVRSPCPSPTPGVYSNSCPLSRWCHSTISSSAVPFSSCLQYFPASGSFWMSVLHIRWPKYWSFSFSISCSKSSLTPQFKRINSLVLSFLYSPTLISIHECWKNHSFD